MHRCSGQHNGQATVRPPFPIFFRIPSHSNQPYPNAPILSPSPDPILYLGIACGPVKLME